MAYPTAAGVPSYSGNYIPTIFSAKTLKRFYEKTVFGAIANTDYEGEIKNQGDEVIIRTVPDITIHKHIKGQKLKVDRPESPPVKLAIDQGWYWQYVAEIPDPQQFDKSRIEEWSDNASTKLKVHIDRDILNTIPPDAHAFNKGATAGKINQSYNLGTTGSPVAITKDNVISLILQAAGALDEQDRDPDGSSRWIVIPSWVAVLIQQSSLADASFSGDSTSMQRNGLLGRIGAFKVYQSNNLLPITDGSDKCFNIMFGDMNSLTFASQLLHTRQLEDAEVFGTLYSGLQVYGYKVVDPMGLGVIYAKKG